ncbi:RMD1 family protein [Lignipirellula cremea]|uniref:DUF155 domain-containing protein n=1 Tax=Lignipirellula cremea TaxID=2528010 RepID=A0A518E3M6_9BACT|nr:hypothetical protein [Lignipirellula cremea]QDU98643.1 hypothetical protein Pla8534_65150 [Lignipirellula cremea]
MNSTKPKKSAAKPSASANHAPSPTGATLPPTSSLQRIAFVASVAPQQQVLLELPHAMQRWAVVVPEEGTPAASPSQPVDSSTLAQPTAGSKAAAPAPAHPAVDLLLLTIPARSSDAVLEAEPDLQATMQQWAEASLAPGEPPCMVMLLQGARICWTPGRVAVLAPPDRLESIVGNLIETAFLEAELRGIERDLGQAWPQLEADLPLAFEFEERSIRKRKQLRNRFQQVLLLRAKLARIGPYVHAPHLHPPTLASQVGERLRERARMPHRHEFLGEQLEVFERVYELCGERSSNFMQTRSGNILEWIIIVLLLAQLLFSSFDLLTSLGQ